MAYILQIRMNDAKVYFTDKADREGGAPLELIVENSHTNGFTGRRDYGINKFFAPCVFYSSLPIGQNQDILCLLCPTNDSLDLW